MRSALAEQWTVIPHGGYWSIVTQSGTIVADDVLHGEYAEHIVSLHNATL